MSDPTKAKPFSTTTPELAGDAHAPGPVMIVHPPSEPVAPELALERKQIEAWRDEKKTPAWLFAAVVAGYRFPVGKELTEAEYLEAVDRTANIPIGYHLPK